MWEVFQRPRKANSMAAVEIEWAEPPAEAFSNSRNGLVIAALKQRVGQWARLKVGSKTSAPANTWKKLGCEAVAHRTNPGENPPTYDIYARWPEPKKVPTPTQAAVASGHALQPAPGALRPKASGPDPFGVGAYTAAQRAARGVPSTGLPLSSLKRGH